VRPKSAFRIWGSDQDWWLVQVARCTANLELPAVNNRRSRVLSAREDVENASGCCREYPGRPVAVFVILHLGMYDGDLALLPETLNHRFPRLVIVLCTGSRELSRRREQWRLDHERPYPVG
jgi:hypothetical protein